MTTHWNDDERAFLIRTAAILTPAQQAGALDMPLDAVWGQRYCLRKRGALHDGAYSNWTEAEIFRARVMVNDGKSPAQVGRALGRSGHAVLAKLNTLGMNVRRELARSEGMDVREVARELGVSRHAVFDWIRRGQLVATRRRVLRQTVYSVSYAAVLSFITERGGYTAMRPTARFASLVGEAKAVFNLRYVGRRDLARSLCISENTLGHWPTRFGFPASRMFGRSSYYDRGEVGRFLAEHPTLAPASFWRAQ
jgi:hypothetical protein